MEHVVGALASALLAGGIPAERAEFVLMLSGGLGAGVERPPPQRLRVPVAWLDPPSRTALESGVANQVRSVSFHVPFEPTESIQVTLEITAASWQERARHYTDPAAGAMLHYKKAPPDSSGLQALVSEDPSKHDNPLERVYLAEDPQLGFVHVKCLGIPERGPRTCQISSELTTYLALNVYLPETQLARWRSVTLAARELVKTLIA